MSVFQYAANVVAHVDFEVEAGSAEEADDRAKAMLHEMPWNQFSEIGHELIRTTGGFEEIERSGEI